MLHSKLAEVICVDCRNGEQLGIEVCLPDQEMARSMGRQAMQWLHSA